MPYVKRVVVAGKVRETKRMYTSRVHSPDVHREEQKGVTTEAQRRCNERKQEELLRWRLNANFGDGDIHLVLHYYDKAVELEKAEEDKRAFLRAMRREYRKREIPWKYVACTETKRMTNVHHHIILPPMDTAVLFSVWERIVGTGGGNISIKPLDHRGNHAKLAAYLVKESRSTVRRYRESGKRYKRFSCAQGMVMPVPEYHIIPAARWTKEPRPSRGYMMLKDDNGATVREGINELTGYPWQEYFELWVGGGEDPPRAAPGGR